MNGGIIRIRQPLWRDLGNEVEPGESTQDALGGIDDAENHVSRHQLYFNAGGEGKALFKPTDRYAFIKDAEADDYAVLSTVSEKTRILRDADFARAIDLLLVGRYQLDTVGRLPERGLTFVVLRSGSNEVAGDRIDCYFLLTYANGLGKGGFTARSVPVRFDCQNTLNAGITQALLDVRLYNGLGSLTQLEHRLKLVPLLEQAEAKSIEAYKGLAAKPIDEAQLVRVLKAVYPEADKPRVIRIDRQLERLHEVARPSKCEMDEAMGRWEQRSRRVVEKRDSVIDFYRAFTGVLASTAWALFNAVVESEDYNPNNKPSSAAEILWFRRAEVKEKTLAACLRV